MCSFCPGRDPLRLALCPQGWPVWTTLMGSFASGFPWDPILGNGREERKRAVWWGRTSEVFWWERGHWGNGEDMGKEGVRQHSSRISPLCLHTEWWETRGLFSHLGANQSLVGCLRRGSCSLFPREPWEQRHPSTCGRAQAWRMQDAPMGEFGQHLPPENQQRKPIYQ